MVDALIRQIYFLVARLFFLIFTRTKVIGLENVPKPGSEPLIIISNHFSYYEVPLLATRLPKMPTFLSAAELAEGKIIGLGMRVFRDRVIPVQRGVVDRRALQEAITQLLNNCWVAIFPEGGITREAITVAVNGVSTNNLPEGNSRLDAQLYPARPGVAFLATTTQARILPISFQGTEKIEGNLKRKNYRRTPVTMRIGRPFGPLSLPEGLRGREKRAYMNRLGDEMMRAIAQLLPEGYRGVYKES